MGCPQHVPAEQTLSDLMKLLLVVLLLDIRGICLPDKTLLGHLILNMNHSSIHLTQLVCMSSP